MKRTTWLVAAVVACASTRVYAAEHLMRINEILVSKNADTGIQFVELLDLNASGESFPLGPYKLEVFDAGGVSIGSTSLTITPTPATGRYIATAAADTAFATTRQDTLGTVLPANGQACFEDNANTKIHCLAWGCITHFVQVAESRTATPPDGMSAQRQTDGTYQIGTPTPNATNVAGTVTVPCATDPLDMPPPADSGIPHDVFDQIPDAPIHDPNNGGGGGCCNVDGRGAAGAIVLALGTLLVLARRRATSSS